MINEHLTVFESFDACSLDFDSATLWIQDKFRVSKKVAIGVLVFLANVCGTLAAMSFGIWLASIASGVGIFPPKI